MLKIQNSLLELWKFEYFILFYKRFVSLLVKDLDFLEIYFEKF